MSAGNISAFATEARKRGKIDFDIDYNQSDRIEELFGLIARTEGLGAFFARGTKPTSEELAFEDMAVHVKGLEPSDVDPRVLKGMGLSYATAAGAACHLRGTFYKAELSGQVDAELVSGKVELHIDYEDRAAPFDCVVLSFFFRDIIGWEDLVLIYEAISGLKRDQNTLQYLANQITQKTRGFIRREGITVNTLPKRFLHEETREGHSLSQADLQTMLDEYNRIRETRETVH